MPVPTWSVGQVLSAADVNNWFTPLAVVKPLAQSVTSSTTMVNDNDLVLPVAASVTYEFRCFLNFTAATGGDLKWTWAVPAGAVLFYQTLHNEGGTTGLSNSTIAYSNGNTIQAAGGGGIVEAVRMDGTLVTSSTAGTLQLQWAQNTSSGTATIVRDRCHLILRRVL
jgi:hypothetical protein